MKARTRFLIGLCVTVLFVGLMFRRLEPGEVARSLSHAGPGQIGAAILAFLLGYACRIERWRIILSQDNPSLRWRQCAGPLMAGTALNNVMPLRAGDLLRAFAFNGRMGTRSTTSVASLIVERSLDIVALIVLLALGLAVFRVDSSDLLGIGSGVLALAGICLALLLLRPSSIRPVVDLLLPWFLGWAPRLEKRIRQALVSVIESLEHVAGRRTMPRLLIWTGLAWLAEGLVFWCVALALPDIAAPAGAWIAMPVGSLATAIPSTPGHIGTFDYFTARAMTGTGNPAEAALAFALLVHIVLWLPPTLLGALYLITAPPRDRHGR